MGERTIVRLMVLLLIAVLIDISVQAVSFYQSYSRNNRRVVRAAADGSTINLSSHVIKGDPNQRRIVVEFSDYECPFCTKHATGVYRNIHDTFIATGKLRYAFVNNPLPIHRDARLLASAAICAGQQNLFWEMHDAIFKKEPRTRTDIVALGIDLNLGEKRFKDCLTNSRTTDQIEEDIAQAKSLGLSMTPSFALGTIDLAGQVRVQQVITGAQPIQLFTKMIEQITILP